ncbi:MAG: hypothetical protein M3178_03250 [Pseudomonadota bacterium]|nr:hypothetical protein [Pseudomonadota bacterium]
MPDRALIGAYVVIPVLLICLALIAVPAPPDGRRSSNPAANEQVGKS